MFRLFTFTHTAYAFRGRIAANEDSQIFAEFGKQDPRSSQTSAFQRTL